MGHNFSKYFLPPSVEKEVVSSVSEGFTCNIPFFNESFCSVSPLCLLFVLIGEA